MSRSVANSLPQGKVVQVLAESPTAAGTSEASLTIDADHLLVSLYVRSIAGGASLDVVVYTDGADTTQSVPVLTFPTITSASTELLIRRPTALMDRVRVVATYTGACSFDVRARGLGLGQIESRVVGLSTATAYQITVGTSAQVIIPAALTDRSGLVLYNNNTTGTVYLGFTLAEATTGNGFPMGPNSTFPADLDAGVAIYGVGDQAVDVRIVEGG